MLNECGWKKFLDHTFINDGSNATNGYLAFMTSQKLANMNER